MTMTILETKLERAPARAPLQAKAKAGHTARGVAAVSAYADIAAARVELIDVRPSEQFRALHIPGAVNIKLSQLSNWARRVARRRTVKGICVYGMDAEQSRTAAHMLAAAGLANVSYLDTGIVGWHDARLPCVAVIDGELVRVVIERVGLPASVVVLTALP